MEIKDNLWNWIMGWIEAKDEDVADWIRGEMSKDAN